MLEQRDTRATTPGARAGGPAAASMQGPSPRAAWNETGMEIPRDGLAHELIAARAAEQPAAPALAMGDETLTYGDLECRANQLAHRLRQLGVGPETPVGLCMERSPHFIVAALGILKAGGAYVPLDPSQPAERLAFMLEDARVPALVMQSRLADRLPRRAPRVVALDADWAAVAREPTSAPPALATPANLAYVIYTSGSTGRPKGVQIEHASLVNLMRWHQRAFALTPAVRATQVAAPGFDAAVCEVWPYLAAGCSLHLPDEETRMMPDALRDWLVARRITHCFLPTALAERMLTLCWPPGTALRVLITAADRLLRYPSGEAPFALYNGYGPTENTVAATVARVHAVEHPDRLPPIGRPIDNVQVQVLGADLRPAPAGTPAELCIGGAGLARGYLRRPALTAERFLCNPTGDLPAARLYRTGDLASWLPDGQLAFHGRIDDQIKIRGYRIEPGEIVAALTRHPAVATAVVLAREDTPGEKRLVAYVVPAPGTSPHGELLRAFLADLVPEYMLPTAFVSLDRLPLTANGKLDRAALPVPALAPIAGAAYLAPRTPTETRIATMAAQLLGVPRVGIEDNIFLFGAHSLLCTQLIGRVREAFGVDLPVRRVFDAPTVAALAEEVEARILARLEAMSEEEVSTLLA